MIKNLLIFVSTLFLCIILSEFLLRFVVNEVDFLKPELMAHPVLRHAIVPGSGGHDEWGFRNHAVPNEVDVVAIGDSQTYGTSVPADKSWPSWLGRFLEQPVYNMGVGGYGPPDYHYLLNEKAKLLNPCLVVVGFNFGNDLPRSYQHAKKKDVTSVRLDDRNSGRHFGNIRSWLSRHSLIYQMSKAIGGHLIDLLLFYEPGRKSGIPTYPVIAEHWRTVLNPLPRFAALDQSQEVNRVGLTDSLEIFDKFQEDCTRMNTRCVILIIPTKFTVYWPIARQILSAEGYQRVQAVVNEEAKVRPIVLDRFKSRGFEFVDPLDALQSAARAESLYPSNDDGHLNARGNEILAREIFSVLGAPPACERPARTAH